MFRITSYWQNSIRKFFSKRRILQYYSTYFLNIQWIEFFAIHNNIFNRYLSVLKCMFHILTFLPKLHNILQLSHKHKVHFFLLWQKNLCQFKINSAEGMCHKKCYWTKFSRMFSSVVTLARVKQRIIHIVQKGIILFHVDNFMAFYANEGCNKQKQL